MKGETRTPEFLANVNANGRIPVLQVGDPDVVRSVRAFDCPGRRWLSAGLKAGGYDGRELPQPKAQRDCCRVPHHFPLTGVRCDTPLPSTMNTWEPASAPCRRSVRPVGQTTSISLTLADFPSPKVSGNVPRPGLSTHQG